MTDPFSESYALCQQLTRSTNSNFFYPLLLLPRAKRRSMYALYAFLRRIDDVADAPGMSLAYRRNALKRLRETLERGLEGEFDLPSLPALVDTINRWQIPPEYLFDVIRGVEMDLEPRPFDTYEDLSTYCHHVASVVGLACIHIWGFAGDEAYEPAKCCGQAFQLTNILRDVKEDAEAGRVYLPTDDLRRFDCHPDQLLQGEVNERFAELIDFEVARAEELYRQGAELRRWLHRDGQGIFNAMLGTYHGLLMKVKRLRGGVLGSRIELSHWQKIHIAARSMFRPTQWSPPQTPSRSPES